MANERQLIDANVLKDKLWFMFKWFGQLPCTEQDKLAQAVIKKCIGEIDKIEPADAVEVKRYEALIEMYHELRENFIDYACSGAQNLAPYCRNRCVGCVDRRGWCMPQSNECKGFNPAEVIIDGERKDNGAKM